MSFSQHAIHQGYQGQRIASPGRSDSEQKMNIGELERVVSVGLGSLLVAHAIKHPSIINGMLGLIGGAMTYRGATGHCPAYHALGVKPDSATAASHPLNRPIVVEKYTAIERTPDDIYAYIREAKNMAEFMPNVKSVEELSPGVWEWTAEGPGKAVFRWKSQLTDQIPGKRLAWETLPGSEMTSRGATELTPGSSERGTTVKFTMEYVPPMGLLGEAVGRITGHSPQAHAGRHLQLMKEILEAGEKATIKGQPRGRPRK